MEKRGGVVARGGYVEVKELWLAKGADLTLERGSCLVFWLVA